MEKETLAGGILKMTLFAGEMLCVKKGAVLFKESSITKEEESPALFLNAIRRLTLRNSFYDIFTANSRGEICLSAEGAISIRVKGTEHLVSEDFFLAATEGIEFERDVFIEDPGKGKQRRYILVSGDGYIYIAAGGPSIEKNIPLGVEVDIPLSHLIASSASLETGRRCDKDFVRIAGPQVVFLSVRQREEEAPEREAPRGLLEARKARRT